MRVMSKLLRDLFSIDKIQHGMEIIQQQGGFKAALYKLYRNDDIKKGVCVGEDKCGNKYFQNNFYFMGRSRWVEYNYDKGLEYDGSQIPAEWFGWLHYKTDTTPHEKPPVQYKWLKPHKENMSGTSEAWMPYSTTPQKIHSWKPPKK